MAVGFDNPLYDKTHQLERGGAPVVVAEKPLLVGGKPGQKK